MFKKISAIVLKVLLIVILAIGGIGILFAGLLGGSFLEIMKTTPEVDAESIKHQMNQNSTIVDKEGNKIGNIITSEYREVVDSKDIPQYLKDAFVSVEDERFYKHKGVDPLSIMGSLAENLKARSIVRGGSTITQQLARNTYLSNDQTVDRKIKEIYLALKIEEVLSKDEILTAYMNGVFLGQNSYGVEAASKTYFSKDVSDLTLAEAATLAGTVKSPTDYALFNTIKASEVTDERVLGDLNIGGDAYKAVYNPNPYDRAEYVLSKMLELGKISQAEYDQAIHEDVAGEINPYQRTSDGNSGYFSDLLQEQVVEKLMDIYNISKSEARDRLYYGGFTITTTIDKDMQDQLQDVYDNFSDYLVGNTQGAGYAPLLSLSYDNYGNIIDGGGLLLYFAKGNILDEKNNVNLRADEAHYDEGGNLIISSSKIDLRQTILDFYDYYDLDENNSNLKTHRIGAIDFKTNDNIWKNEDGTVALSKAYLDNHQDLIIANEDGSFSLNKEYYSIDLDGVLQPQSSCVIIDQKTGEIKAIMGGRGQSGSKILNRASAQPRQPGSSIKPLATYTAALDNGYNLATGIDDVPFMKDEDGNPRPKNVYEGYKGIVSLRESLVYSINTNAVRTLKDIGIETSEEYLKNFGIIRDNGEDNFITEDENSKTNDENLAALGLGAMTHGLTNLEMTGAFAALANGGTYLEPLCFSEIKDAEGKVIFNEKDKVSHEVTSPQTAIQITSALQDCGIHYETIDLGGTEFATKTGTSDNNVDFRCLGYTPYYTVGIWMGADNQNIHLDSYSSVRAAKMWSVVNNAILDGYAPESFTLPDGMLYAQVDTISGKLPTAASLADPRGTVKNEMFSEKNYPKEEDDIHVWRSVDTRNNLLASNTTPQNLIRNGSFIQRPIPYNPNEWGGIIPDDRYLSVPQTYSNLGSEKPEESSTDEKKKPEEKEREPGKSENTDKDNENGEDKNPNVKPPEDEKKPDQGKNN